MKKTSRVLVLVSAIVILLLSACGSAPHPGSAKVQAVPVAFAGIVESIASDQWVINGQTVTIDPAVVRDGPFRAGDYVKVEAVVNSDGSLTISRVEAAGPQDLSTLPQFGNDNSSSDNSNDANVNDDNSNDANVNDANSNDANINDDDSNNTNVNDDSEDANVNEDNSNSNLNDNSSNSNEDNSNTVNSNDDGSGNDSGGGGNSNGGDD